MDYWVNVFRGMVLYLSLLLTPISTVTTYIEPDSDSKPTTTAEIEISQPVVSLPSSPTPQFLNTTPQKLPVTNYEMVDHPSGEEGFYVLKNAPAEPMSTVEELNQAVNQYRQTHGLNQLEISTQLCEIASQRAQEVSQEFSHAQFQEHAQNGDYNHVNFQTISENIWEGSFSAVHIVEYGWDRSSGHRANLQGPWTKGCAAIYQTAAVFVFAN